MLRLVLVSRCLGSASSLPRVAVLPARGFADHGSAAARLDDLEDTEDNERQDTLQMEDKSAVRLVEVQQPGAERRNRRQRGGASLQHPYWVGLGARTKASGVTADLALTADELARVAELQLPAPPSLGRAVRRRDIAGQRQHFARLSPMQRGDLLTATDTEELLTEADWKEDWDLNAETLASGRRRPRRRRY